MRKSSSLSDEPLSKEEPVEKDFIRVFSRVFQMFEKPLLSGSEFDDCAAVRLDSFCRDLSAESLTFSTDTVRESSDFPKSMTPWQKGWMAAAVNLSDLAAMGSKPVAFLFSAGLPAGFTLTDAKTLAQGIQDAVSFFGGEVVGGDTEFCEELTITGTVVGISENKNLTFRKHAVSGDLLCVTGAPGSAGVALSLLLNDIETAVSVSDSFIKNLTEPFPRIAEGLMLSKSGAVTSMIDTSDGLAFSVHELSSLSGAGFEISEQALLSAADPEALEILEKRVLQDIKTQNNDNGHLEDARDAQALLLQNALYTGGDYELLFTVSPDKIGEVEEIFRTYNESCAPDFNKLPSDGKSGRYPCRFTIIGKAIAESETVIFRQSRSEQIRRPLLKKGYDSFKKYI
ncbi:MAG: thiamine-phosphate kinase [Methanimicrococcus sp.]|nr:thiamine-phosphate kinase [Methanimicrococcus sp.]